MAPAFYQIRLLFAFVLGYENKGEIAHTFGLNKYGQSERAKAIRKLDDALSQLIRARDRSYITCGRGDIPLDAGHFRRRECMATRFD
jgi:hypothetical protein